MIRIIRAPTRQLLSGMYMCAGPQAHVAVTTGIWGTRGLAGPGNAGPGPGLGAVAGDDPPLRARPSCSTRMGQGTPR